MTAKQAKGFTLIEIIVTMIIVGALAAVAIPNFSNSIVQTKIDSVKNNLRGIGAAQEKYHEDKSVYYASPNGAVNDFGAINSNLTLSMSSVNDGFNYLCAASGTCCAANGTYPSPPGTTVCVDANGNLTTGTGGCAGVTGCDGVCNSGKVVGGCDNQCGSVAVNDACGTCGGNVNTVGSCTATLQCGSTTGTNNCGSCIATAGTCSGARACCTSSHTCSTLDVCNVCSGSAGSTCPTNETCSGDTCVCTGTTDLCGRCGGTCTAANNENCNGPGNTCECASGYTGTPGSCVASCTPDGGLDNGNGCCNGNPDFCGICAGNGNECDCTGTIGGNCPWCDCMGTCQGSVVRDCTGACGGTCTQACDCYGVCGGPNTNLAQCTTNSDCPTTSQLCFYISQCDAFCL